ncbi:MAG: hypothetical protein JWN86_3077 [Planctomycetota bacterium]|nr:hypothetical protein [Planctomycetota bacterium]
MGREDERIAVGEALGLGATGLIYGCVVGVLAIGLAGGGHGWNSASISGAGVLLLPGFGVALATPRRGRRGLLLLIAAGMLMTDAFLVLAAWGEGVSYLRRVWAAAPGALTLWAVLWSAWQFAVLGVLARDGRR